ncbi:carbohydrate kinase family protein [Pelomyxa schiedti]|nr:carbohydrate kinase family protein [Pelomyxa schiedti]
MFSRRGTDKHYLAIEISTKLNVRSVNFWPGGSASNIAVDLAKLGLSTAFFGGLGTDPPSESCMADFTQYNVDTSGVARFEEHPTGLSVILSAAGRDNGDRTVMAFKGASDHYNKSFCKEDVIRRTTILVWTSLTSDCGVEAIDHCITMARDDRIMIAGAPSISIIQNRTEDARRLVKRCHVVSMNEEEMFKLTEECDPEAAIKRILSWGSTTTVVLLTRGKQGAWLVDKRVNKIVKTTPPTGITVCDTTGAGDASMAGLLLGLVRKRTPEKCALYAVALGSLEVSTPGVRQGIPRSVTELELYIRDHPMEQDSDWWEK